MKIRMKICRRESPVRIWAAWSKVLTRAARAALVITACSFVGCASLNVQKRSSAEIQVAGTYTDLQSAVRHAAENLGGEVVEYPNSSPEQPGMKAISSNNISGWFAGYTAIAQNPTLDTIYYVHTADSAELTVHSHHPVILAAAIAQELAHPSPAREAEQRDSSSVPMTSKSKPLFMAMSMIEPAIGNTYLFADNPFVLHADIIPEIAFPLLVDAGLIYFLIAEHDKPSRPGTYILGTVALTLRVVGIAGFSADIDRYNTLVRSGYDLSLDALRDLQGRLTLSVNLP